MSVRIWRTRIIVLAATALVASSAAWATNGMYLAAHGAEASGRGGTNIAIADRALGLQSNPAGISQLQGNHFSIDLQILMPDLDYNDPFGNSIEGDSRQFFMPSISYVRGGKGSKWTWGIGLFSQGGMGATFKGYTYPSPPFPPVVDDQTFSQVRFMSINPTVAYGFNDNLSIGLSAILGYSDVEFRFWPETSTFSGTPDPMDDFYGLNLTKGATTFNYAARLGLMWRALPSLQFGLIYQTKTESDYDDGELVLNTSALGLPNVTYGKTSVDGFTWPEQYGIGVQWKVSPKVMLALDVKEYKWSDAVELITVVGREPNTPGFPPEFPVPFVFEWQDQTVYALGAEWRTTEALTLRAGYNHGDSPVPDETLNPLFPAITEDHATLGLGWTSKKGHTFNFAVERAFENTQTTPSMNPMLNPFGPGATVSHSQWTLSFGWSWAFSR